MCCVVTVFTLSNVESNKSKCYPALPGAWVPANAGTRAEPLYIYIYYKNISRTLAVISKNLGSILIFASCVVGACNILCR